MMMKMNMKHGQILTHFDYEGQLAIMDLDIIGFNLDAEKSKP